MKIAMKMVPSTVQIPKNKKRYPITNNFRSSGIAIAIAKVVAQTMKVAIDAALSYRISAR